MPERSFFKYNYCWFSLLLHPDSPPFITLTHHLSLPSPLPIITLITTLHYPVTILHHYDSSPFITLTYFPLSSFITLITTLHHPVITLHHPDSPLCHNSSIFLLHLLPTLYFFLKRHFSCNTNDLLVTLNTPQYLITKGSQYLRSGSLRNLLLYVATYCHMQHT